MFEEASISGQQPPAQTQPGEMTTDDLVLMIGEGAIRERQAAKIRAHYERQIIAMQQDALKERSQAMARAEQEKIAAVDLIRQDKDNSVASLQARIADLERQVYRTACERDEAIKAGAESKPHAGKGVKNA